MNKRKNNILIFLFILFLSLLINIWGNLDPPVTVHIETSSSNVLVISSGNEIGGLVGSLGSYSSIDNSYSSGNVNGNDSVGGLVGVNYGDINNTYSSGNINGITNFGGLIGNNPGGSIINSYWDNETSGQSISAGGVGKNTADMKTALTFVSWDSNIWSLNDGFYPKFIWE